jgi:hypothetical protein
MRHRWGTVVAFTVGSVGISIEIGYVVARSYYPELEHAGFLEEVMIILLCFLFVGLGVERLTTFNEIDEKLEAAMQVREGLLATVRDLSTQLSRLEMNLPLGLSQAAVDRAQLRTQIAETLAATGSAKAELLAAVSRVKQVGILTNVGAVEVTATDLVKVCDERYHILATAQYPDDTLSPAYFAALASKVAGAKRLRGRMEYHVILSGDAPAASEARKRRHEAFAAAKCEERMKPRYIKHAWPFELLIAGDSMIIALRGHRTTYEAVVTVTDAEFVRHASDWFDDLWENEVTEEPPDAAAGGPSPP